MSTFDLIFGSAFIAIWSALGGAPWLLASVVTRGRAGIGLLPLCLLAGVSGGMIVPFLGFTATSGIWMSFAGAAGLSGLLVIARRLALSVRPAPGRTATSPGSE